MPPSDPATVRLADCPVGAVVLWPPHGAQDAGFVETDDAEHWPDLSVRLIAPSLAALVARAEAGERLAEEASNLECRASTLLLSTAPGRITSDPRGVEGEILEDRSELGKALGSFRAALAAYRKATV